MLENDTSYKKINRVDHRKIVVFFNISQKVYQYVDVPLTA